MRRTCCAFSLALVACLVAAGAAADGNRLAYLDESCDPYYAGLATAKLVTPQWVGEPGVVAVVVLSIDDLSDTARYEKFARPFLDRLKKIDGRSPVSLMANKVDPRDPRLSAWLHEGLSLEPHTFDHPCPLLQGGDLAKAKDKFDRSVDVMASIPGNRPVAFRMPCCDSMNTVSPRFFTEILGRTTPQGRFVGLDSSVLQLFTRADPALPRELVTAAGGERFRPYVLAERQFVNLVENYPYPYVIGRLCWEMPGVIPDDNLGRRRHGNAQPASVADMKAAIDATVVKQGQFTLIFHPHGWITSGQIVELIDYAVEKHGRKIKFLNFREVYDRLTQSLLAGHPLRAANGQDNGVRVLDVDGDGYMDVVIANEHLRQTRLWSPKTGAWSVLDFPAPIVSLDRQGKRHDAGVRFGVLARGGAASVLLRNEQTAGLWHFDGGRWVGDPGGLAGLDAQGPVFTSRGGRDQGVRLRDLDGDGIGELIVGNERQQAAFAWSGDRHAWTRLPFSLPRGTAIVDAQGRDAGLRLVDVNGDGRSDVVFSNAQQYSVDLFVSLAEGWPRRVLAGRRGGKNDLPMIVLSDGTNGGVWFNYGRLWQQNEYVRNPPPIPVESRSFAEDLVGKTRAR